MQEVGGSIPPGSTNFHRAILQARSHGVTDATLYVSPSSRGLGHHPFTVATGVRIPVGTPIITLPSQGRPVARLEGYIGAIAQLGERLHGMQEVSGSIPLGSTIFFIISRAAPFAA